MTPKQRWHCFWGILVISILLLAALLWVALQNPQASFYTVISNLWDSITGA